MELIDKGIINKDFEPIKCDVCGCTEFIDNVKEVDAGITSEFQRHCKNCNRILGYWAYGYWQV